MACSCGGGATYPSPSLTGVATPPAAAASRNAGKRWLVTYPNGATATFTQEWQVNQAIAMSGGTFTELTPEGDDVMPESGGAGE